MVDPNRQIAWFLVLDVAWTAFEIGSQVVDPIKPIAAWSGPNSSWKGQISTAGLFAVGMVAPGGGYTQFRRGTKFYHYTSPDGVNGITGIDPESMAVATTRIVNELRFGQGQNPYQAARSGDIFVTEVGPNPSALQLEQIGVFGQRQCFCISFSREAAFSQDIHIEMVREWPSIWTIPGGSHFGPDFSYEITRLR